MARREFSCAICATFCSTAAVQVKSGSSDSASVEASPTTLQCEWVTAAGPELRRMYALAAELDVPILIHFQEVSHTPTPSGPTSTQIMRHQDKLIFGAVARSRTIPRPSRMAGKCVARQTLSLLKGSTSPAVFRKLTWENAHKTYRLKA